MLPLLFRSLMASQFLSLQTTLETPFALPPKRVLVTTFIPSAWLDDALIAERKAGLSAYLREVLQSKAFQSHPQVVTFLQPSASAPERFNPEDAVPSTLSRKAAAAFAQRGLSTTATCVAAAYYPDWSFDDNPPESLNYSKFDVLFFGWVSSHLLVFIDLTRDLYSICDAQFVIEDILGRWEPKPAYAFSK